MSGTLSDEDRAVLSQLKAAGDIHTIGRPVIHWIFGEEKALREISSRLKLAGWDDLEPRRDEDGWLMTPTKQTALTDAALLAMNAEIAAAIENLNVTYDGWETSAEQKN